jgi:hypothetical protein
MSCFSPRSLDEWNGFNRRRNAVFRERRTRACISVGGFSEDRDWVCRGVAGGAVAVFGVGQ